MDFFRIKERSTKNGVIEVYPDFRVCRSRDLMVRGKSFYGIWDDEEKIWSTDEYDVQRLVDMKIMDHTENLKTKTDGTVQAKLMSNYSSKAWAEFKSYMSHISDNAKQLDAKLTFANTVITKDDYVSKRLGYDLKRGACDAYDEIIGTLYTPEERAKLEWAIGAIVSGEAKNIQKFIVLYGDAGAGKSTILNIIQLLFEGYYTTFEAKALTASGNAFSTEVFKTNPLVAIQHDGDLSKIEDNTKLNSIVSHEEMTLNEKYKPSYMSRINAFLFMATNRPVKITDAKSGIIRRLIDVKPSGNKLPPSRYHVLMDQVVFELGAIAHHCLDTFNEMGKNYYSNYKPLDMIFQTDVFFNFVEAHYHVFKDSNGVSLKHAYDMYKTYCDDSLVNYKLSRHKFREELKNYFSEFNDIARIEGKQVRSYYSGFQTEKFKSENKKVLEEKTPSISLDYSESIIDKIYGDRPAQYATGNETPHSKWEEIKSTLSELDTSKVHYVRMPLNHIVIDFDIKDENGNKSLELNMKEASKWPPTYTEVSKGGNGIHLHYLYDGDSENLSRIYDKDIEIKVFSGKSSLRRKLTKCNNTKISTISSGLPLKGVKMINFDSVKNEKHLRSLITKNLNKEIHPGTKPSIDFIHKILNDTYDSGVGYDVTDMAPKILAFAGNSSNQREYCVNLVARMKFKSENPSTVEDELYSSEELAFYDVEVFPNLFVVCWKFKGSPSVVKMINPTPADIEALLKLKLIGFNVRRYDNHILYARYIGYTNEQLFKLSQKIIDNSKTATFAEAYGLSYADIYEFSSKRQSLKKWEIELGIHHMELGLPWDQPVPEDKWELVADYCCNDVIATEAVFDDRKQDWIARQILAKLSGLTNNDTTQKHGARILFGKDKNPQTEFVYTDLSLEFPGYEYKRGKSTYRGEDVGEGGYVYAEPGMYGNVALLDVESMHPNSAINLNMFGIYTKNYESILNARLAIKHGEVDKAIDILSELMSRTKGITIEEATKEIHDIVDSFGGDVKGLSYALKLVINMLYGMTAAKFDNPFRDPKNKDNIMAKRGALFMMDLKYAVQEKGFTVMHVKTDSIKIPDATQEIIDFVFEFGTQYGYKFDHEATYDKICLVNDAVYIAKDSSDNHWSATGAQFAHPYVFKTLFSNEEVVFKDLCETKSTTSALYLDMNEKLWNEECDELEKELKKLTTQQNKYLSTQGNMDMISGSEFEGIVSRIAIIEDKLDSHHNYQFVGKVGSFCPMLPGTDAGLLMREKDGKYFAAGGTKGYRWMEAEIVEKLNMQDKIDMTYFAALADAAIKNIESYGDFEWFRSEEKYNVLYNGILPF